MLYKFEAAYFSVQTGGQEADSVPVTQNFQNSWAKLSLFHVLGSSKAALQLVENVFQFLFNIHPFGLIGAVAQHVREQIHPRKPFL